MAISKAPAPNWTVALAIVLGTFGNGRTAIAQPAEPLTLSLLILDQSGVPPVVLARAEAEATRIYSQAGVRLVWTDQGVSEADFRFIVKILATALTEKEVDAKALGVAPRSRTARGKIAFVFYGRIEEFTRSQGVDPGVILGHVIAHEIGHLTLPYYCHTITGLMMGRWDEEQARRALRGSLMFNADESALIRQTVAAGLGGGAHEGDN
jgi:hypothetical protein